MKSVFVCGLSVVLLASSVARGITINTNTRIVGTPEPLFEPIEIVNGLSPPTVVDIVSPADIAADIQTYGLSRLNVYGGLVGGGLRAYDDSEIHIFGGERVASGEDIVAAGNSRVFIWGGDIGTGSDEIAAVEHGRIEIHGGILRKRLAVTESGTIDVFGRNMVLSTLSEPSQYWITGNLADGSLLNHPVEVRDNGKIQLHEVSEPQAMLTLLVGVTGGLFIRRKSFSRNGKYRLVERSVGHALGCNRPMVVDLC